MQKPADYPGNAAEDVDSLLEFCQQERSNRTARVGVQSARGMCQNITQIQL
jgi:hypothetical protein